MNEAAAGPHSHERKASVRHISSFKEASVSYTFILPWLLGFVCFVIGPMFASLYLSFTKYDMLSGAVWTGMDNYIQIFTDDERFYKSLRVTLLFVFISVPLKLIFALAIAILFNTNRRGVGLYRTVYYIPSILGGSVAVAVMWKQLFGKNGALNDLLSYAGIKGVTWIASPDYAIYTLVALVIWQFGSPMLIFLAGLKQIPKELYEAAQVDGANRFRQFTLITLPMLTPIIFFNLVMQIIGGFMTFTQSFLITNGGPLDETLFYAVYLYEKAFRPFSEAEHSSSFC